MAVKPWWHLDDDTSVMTDVHTDMAMQAPLLEIRNLTTSLSGEEAPVRAVDGVDIAIGHGETYALLGESGCGKSMTALSVARLLPDNGRVLSGTVRLNGTDLLGLAEARMREARGKRIGMIFQELGTSLNPVLTLGDQIAEVIERHTPLRGDEVLRRSVELLDAGTNGFTAMHAMAGRTCALVVDCSMPLEFRMRDDA